MPRVFAQRKRKPGTFSTYFSIGLATAVSLSGCQWARNVIHPEPAAAISQAAAPSLSSHLTVDYPELKNDPVIHEDVAQPASIKEFDKLKPMPLTLEDAIQTALRNSKVLNKLGGQVVTAPQGSATVLDPANTATSPGLSSEAALSAFDTQFTASAFLNHTEQTFNNPFFGGGASALVQNTSPIRVEFRKVAATGTTFSLRNVTDYSKSNAPSNNFPGAWNTVMLAEIRQPLLAGAGVDVNRIAGPNGTIGNYNGVLIARIREDISIADFQNAVRGLVRDVERTYWQLHFAYQDLNTTLAAREASRRTWENRKKRFDGEVGRPDEEAQARQQYFNFERQVQNAVAGQAGGVGLYSTERNLRRLLDLPPNDGTILRPTTDPIIAPVKYDWVAAQQSAMDNRVELRRQRWVLRQSELELIAAKNLSQWSVDLVANYGARGFGDNLVGDSGALRDMFGGDLDDWQLGIEVAGPVGRRAGLVGVRNAKVNLARNQVLLEEQQKQIQTDLSAAYTEVERAFEDIRNSVNARIATEAELIPRRKRVETGADDIFFLLEAEQRAATNESQVHRSILNYNLALVDFAFQSGSLLSAYNIQLEEAPSVEGLIQAADRQAESFLLSNLRYPSRPKVSEGFPRQAPPTVGEANPFRNGENAPAVISESTESSAPAEPATK